MLKRTALFEEHQKLGGRIVDFGGWELPVQYTGVMDEHEACRSAAGLFDVSHMGEVHVEGADSEGFLNYLVTNNVAKLAVGQAQYNAMCHESGGIVDDLVIYRRARDRFLVVVNASNTDKDFKHMLEVRDRFQKLRARGSNEIDLSVTNESARYTQIAIQGRNAAGILGRITTADLKPIKNYWFIESQILGGIPAILARTGYTGEDGFEIYVAWDKGPEVWRALLKEGAVDGIKACGLGARDTLRLEMKYPLYGNELSDETNPLEAGLGWVVKLDKGDFLGRDAIVRAKEKGLNRQLVGFKLLERGIPRHGYSIYNVDGSPSNDVPVSESAATGSQDCGIQKIGEVTSGTQSPSLKQSVGIGYVKTGPSKTGAQAGVEMGSKFCVEIRGTKVLAEVVPTPFYKRPY